MGDTGKDECPEGYKEIYEELVCEIASYYLGLTYYERNNVNNSRSVCFWCGGCDPEITLVSIYYGSLAKWICQKGIKHKFLLIPVLHHFDKIFISLLIFIKIIVQFFV